MKLPKLLDVLDEQKIENPMYVRTSTRLGSGCAAVSSFMKKPYRSVDFRPIAMSVLASGAIPAREGNRVCVQAPKIEAIVFRGIEFCEYTTNQGTLSQS